MGIPSFAPEILRRVRLDDAIRAKKLREALKEMAEEGAVQLFSPVDGAQPIVGVIGQLQLDVLADRLANEYGLPIGFEVSAFDTVRWIAPKDAKNRTIIDQFVSKNRSAIAEDIDGARVFFATSTFNLNWTQDRAPDIAFTDIKTVIRG
jgi:peptide chain release factor 3